MNDLHDLRQLKELTVYAAGIYSTMSGDPCETWRPLDHASGLLSQLSNTLRGIHDLAASGPKLADACAESILRAEKAEAERDAAVRELYEARRFLSVANMTADAAATKLHEVIGERMEAERERNEAMASASMWKEAWAKATDTMRVCPSCANAGIQTIDASRQAPAAKGDV